MKLIARRKIAHSRDIERVIDVLNTLIRERDFMLTESELEEIESQHNNQLISGWIFAYRLYSYNETKMIRVLGDNILNANPRIREQVCDIIGDESITELRSELKKLFKDPYSYVSEAARYNHEEL